MIFVTTKELVIIGAKGSAGMDMGLSGKFALVTGASRGLGYATAHLLALEGARVVINGRRPEQLNEAAANIRNDTGGEV